MSTSKNEDSVTAEESNSESKTEVESNQSVSDVKSSGGFGLNENESESSLKEPLYAMDLSPAVLPDSTNSTKPTPSTNPNPSDTIIVQSKDAFFLSLDWTMRSSKRLLYHN